MKQLYRLSHEESLHPSRRILTIKTLSDRNWIFVICAVIRLPLTQTSEIHTEAHTSAEISQVFPLFYSGTKTFHIDFAAAEIHSVQFVTVSKCSCCRTDRVCEPTSDLRAWSFSVFCVDLLVILYVSLLKQVLACCSANVGRRCYCRSRLITWYFWIGGRDSRSTVRQISEHNTHSTIKLIF